VCQLNNLRPRHSP